MNPDTITNLTIIAWEGNVNDTTYIIPTAAVGEFMEKWNDHGSWKVVSQSRNCFLGMNPSPLRGL